MTQSDILERIEELLEIAHSDYSYNLISEDHLNGMIDAYEKALEAIHGH